MKLIGSYTSPFVRKISIMLLEKEVTFEFVNESPLKNDNTVIHYNPLGEVPALMISQNEIWFDSSVIAARIEQLEKSPPFLPSTPADALSVRQLEALADGICDAAIIIVCEQKRNADQQSELVLTHQREKIQRGLDALEQAAADRKWLNGKTINLADIATGCMAGYLNLRHVAPNWCVDRPALVKLVEKLFQRDSFAQTTPPPD